MAVLRFAVLMAALSFAPLAYSEPETFDTVIEGVGTALEGYCATALPIVGTIVVASLAIWGIPRFVRLLRRGIG